MSRRETIALPGRELRIQPNADGSRSVTGLIPYNSPSEGLPWTEIIKPGAFSEAFKPDADVLLLRNHNSDALFGRTKAGTLSLSDTPKGLAFRCQLPRITLSDDLVESMSRGDLTGTSFGFVCRKDDWSEGKAGVLTRSLTAVDLHEISIVTSPAYANSVASLRSIPEKYRGLLKRSHADGCDCDCSACADGNCDGCEDQDCEDEACGENGCPNQGDDEERSWAANMLLRIEVAKRQ